MNNNGLDCRELSFHTKEVQMQYQNIYSIPNQAQRINEEHHISELDNYLVINATSDCLLVLLLGLLFPLERSVNFAYFEDGEYDYYLRREIKNISFINFSPDKIVITTYRDYFCDEKANTLIIEAEEILSFQVFYAYGIKFKELDDRNFNSATIAIRTKNHQNIYLRCIDYGRLVYEGIRNNPFRFRGFEFVNTPYFFRLRDHNFYHNKKIKYYRINRLIFIYAFMALFVLVVLTLVQKFFPYY